MESGKVTEASAMNEVTRRIGVALFDDAEELDWAGPWEVLSYWAHMIDGQAEVFTLARSRNAITCAKGLRVLPERAWEDVSDIDVLVYPGGRGVRRQIGDRDTNERLRGLAASGTLMTSVCTGALVFAGAGLLDDRAATTHWSALEELAGLGRNIDVRPNDRFVDTGDVVTAAGVSAGIDMAVHLVARLDSVERARAVCRGIQYDPRPPLSGG